MNDTEKLQDNNDITVVISDYEEPCRTGRSGDKPERPGLPVAAKLAALWSLLFGLFVGIPFIFFNAWLGDDYGAVAVVIAALLFVCAHTAASAVSFGRYKRKYNVPARKFVLLNALPLLALGAVSFLAAWTVGGWDGLFFAIIAICYGGYSVVYGVLLTAALGIEHLIKKCGGRT